MKGRSGGAAATPRKDQMTTTAAAATVSQELSPFGRALGASRPGTKYPVRGIPHFDNVSFVGVVSFFIDCLSILIVLNHVLIELNYFELISRVFSCF